ncbi:MAG: His-Xaa-Ser repeat protein HxsA [Alphaproteobacteria bacterium]
MKKKAAFFVSSLITAGMHLPSLDANAAAMTGASTLDNDQTATVWNFKSDRGFTLAGHRSHSSHGSHGSHRSSSSGGYKPRPSPTPNYTPPPVKNYNDESSKSSSSKSDSTPPTSILPQSPATSPKVTKIHGNSKAFKVLVMQVQTALFALSFYNGTIDGVPGPETSAAISRYQLKNDLPVTGRLSDTLLDSLHIDTSLIEPKADE